MYWPILITLLAATIVMLLIERSGVRTTLQLSFKGDLKRETAFLAQWGQSVATPLAAILVYQLDPLGFKPAWVMICAVLGSSVSCRVLKQVLGRARPNREHAGKFLGPSWKHSNYRESFPSSHSACAITLSVFLANLYPPAAVTFWALGLSTALIRYVLDAHFPSDILGGIALGYSVAHWWLGMFHIGPRL